MTGYMIESTSEKNDQITSLMELKHNWYRHIWHDNEYSHYPQENDKNKL